MPTDGLSGASAFEMSSLSEVSFNEIMPIPKILAKRSKKRGEDSEIITSSPYKKRLATSKKDKKSKGESKPRKQKKGR